MTTQWIDIAARDGGTYGAYLALPPRPAANGRNPGLVLFQEIFGVNAHIRTVAEQYALSGFVVLAPDLFWRDAPRIELGYEGADLDRAMQLMKAADGRQLADDVVTTVAALRARPEVAVKVGSIGYCMGGRLAYVAAATAAVDAAVCYYGGGIQNQLELAAQISCPVQFHYAGDDPNIPPDAVAKVEEAFVGKEAEFHLYPGANHGFNCWARGAYDARSAALAHGRTLAFLAERLFR